MARKQQPIPAAIRKRLETARVARLATLDAQRAPHVVPICFVFDGSVFYTALDRKPKRVRPEELARVRNIRANQHVALIVDEYHEDWSKLWYVLVRGKAQLLPDTARAERARALRRLRAKYPQYVAGMVADDAPIIRITPERISSWGCI